MSARAESDDQLTDAVTSAMAAARVFVAITAASTAQVEDRITLPQYRTLVLSISRDALNVGDVASALGIHTSNASRLCDRLVEASLLARRPALDDRRQQHLEATKEGKRLISIVMRRRRKAIEAVLRDFPDEDLRELSRCFTAFSLAAGELPDGGRWLPD